MQFEQWFITRFDGYTHTNQISYTTEQECTAYMAWRAGYQCGTTNDITEDDE